MLARVIQAVFAASYAALIPAHKNAWVIFQMFGQCCCTWITSLAYIASGLFVPQEELGVSASLTGTFCSAGGSLDNAIFTTIANYILNKQVAPHIAATAIGWLRTCLSRNFDPRRQLLSAYHSRLLRRMPPRLLLQRHEKLSRIHIPMRSAGYSPQLCCLQLLA
jgi:hypothetical protein